ncbi:MAG: hypothetical protein ABIV36_18425 [Sphingobium limneticum]
MSRDTIEVRECDRCKIAVEARSTDSFEGWGSAMATGQSDGERTGFADADLCPECFGFLLQWFTSVTRERDAKRTCAPRPERAAIPSIKEIAAKLISDNLDQSPEMAAYFARLEEINSLDDLRDYQASNALILMQWLGDPGTAEQVTERHRATFERIEALTPDEVDAQ